MHRLTFSLALCVVTAGLLPAADSALPLVEVKSSPRAAWTNYPTRTLDQLPAVPLDGALSQYGGIRARQVTATGFFYPTNLNQRWWLVDPEGYLFIDKSVASVSLMSGPSSQAAFERRFGGSKLTWATNTANVLRAHGFNGLGAWSDAESFRKSPEPMVYTRIWNFMSSYGQKRGGTYQKPGHIGYPQDCIFVFDPEFETFCDDFARRLAATKGDPWLLGHFSDNELPIKREALKNYLQMPEKDPGHQAALKFLRERHGAEASAKDITELDRQDFLTMVVDRYFRIVSRAIKKHDPNHLFLGSRFHSSELNYPEVFRAAGAYLDVIAVNYYRAWTPSQEKLAMWSRESGRPIVITEWYVKGEDSGLPNNSGAGWIVRTQKDRGRFYQHFTLGLLESRVCVGWHWFKYTDNDPTVFNAEPSNRDSNKGIVTSRYETYPELLQAMKALNARAYSLADLLR